MALSSETVQRLVVLGYILAVSMPPLGLILAIVIAKVSVKPTAKHAVGIVLVSLVASVIWFLIIAAGALNTPTTDF
jgi:hypothetical protein